MSNTMKKQEFYNNFMDLLSQELGIKSYFNSSKLIEVGIKPITDDSLGECRSWRDDTPVIIKYRKGREKEMLGTLIHEYAHAILHKKNDKLSSPIKEIEAETVAQNVLRYFSITDVTLDYINIQKEKCKKTELEEYEKSNRANMVENLSKRIIDILEVRKNVIKKISNKSSVVVTTSQYKYGIMCPCCNRTIARYKRATTVTKNKGEGCYCGTCGREKTLDKLILINY